jgi:hypothetical protein
MCVVHREPAALLLHPAHLAAMALLAINDHVLKDAWPGPVTGKLSDVAGLVVLPIFVASSVELALGRRVTAPVVAAIAVACAGGFAAVQVWPDATRAYTVGLGWLQWLATGAHGAPRTVAVTADPTDLWTLPTALLPVLLCRRPRRGAGARRRAASMADGATPLQPGRADQAI